MVQEVTKRPRDRLDIERIDPVEDAVEFEYSNIEPDENLKMEVKGLVHRIYEHTPDGSVITGTLKKVRKGYKGVFKIIHGGGQMIVYGLQKSTTGTLEVLEEKIWGKIRKWRKNRFRDLKEETETI